MRSTEAIEHVGIQCGPDIFARYFTSFIVFLISFAAICSMGVVAGGSFWAAQSMARLTDGVHRLQLVRCCPVGTPLDQCDYAATCPN